MKISLSRAAFQKHCADCPQCRSLVQLCLEGVRLYKLTRDEARAELLAIKGAK